MDKNFFSMDKLIEFGMGMTVANQMASSMNQTFNKISIPGTRKDIVQKIENVYYAVIDEKQCGPYSLADISRLIREKKIVKETYIWKPGLLKWELAENVDEIVSLVALTPPPIP